MNDAIDWRFIPKVLHPNTDRANIAKRKKINEPDETDIEKKLIKLEKLENEIKVEVKEEPASDTENEVSFESMCS